MYRRYKKEIYTIESFNKACLDTTSKDSLLALLVGKLVRVSLYNSSKLVRVSLYTLVN